VSRRPSPPDAARVAAAVACLAVCGWFGLAVRQQAGLETARELRARSGPYTAAEARAAAAALDRAGTLNPDTDVDLARANDAFERDRRADAKRLLLGVVRREPENAGAWGAIALLLEQDDPALARRAVAMVRRLSPPVPAN
jgi:hypothetical protein